MTESRRYLLSTRSLCKSQATSRFSQSNMPCKLLSDQHLHPSQLFLRVAWILIR